MRRVNWGQALAEVALLLLGAGVAFGLDSWRDEAADRAAERGYLMALRTDFEATDSLFRLTLRGYEDQLRHNEAFLELIADPAESVPSDGLARMVRKAFQWGDFEPQLATYRDMNNSGDLRLLQNDSLRLALAEFEAVVETMGSLNQVALDQWSGPVSQFMVENLNTTVIYGSDSGFQWGDVWIDPIGHTPAVDRSGDGGDRYWDQEFANHLAIRNVTLTDAMFWGEQSIGLVGDVLRLIAASEQAVP